MVSCNSLPRINIAEIDKEICSKPYVNQTLTLVHIIKSKIADKYINIFYGITHMDPKYRILKTEIFTLEGLSLLRIEKRDSKIKVVKSVKPFDSKHMQLGMLNDIQFILFKPIAALFKVGLLGNGKKICRFKQTGNNKYIDILRINQDEYSLNKYADDYSLEKSVYIKIEKHEGISVPAIIKMKTYGIIPYSLDLKLQRIQK